MKNKKGFTLIELLAVIAILGLVVAIAIPSIIGIVDKNSNKIDSTQMKEFISLAKIWGNDNNESIKNGECYFMSLADMVNINLLDEIPNNNTGNKYSETSGIEIKKSGDKLNYEYVESSSCSSFSNVENEEIIYDNSSLTIPSGVPSFIDRSGANPPKLAEGMIPVVYDEATDNWVVADKLQGWYNYNNQIWANAVTVSDASLRNAAPGTVLPMDKINSMWVWIPRYKYKITGSIGSGSNVTNPPQIKVEFENSTGTSGTSLSSCSITSTTCFYTHPAFRNGNSATLLTSTQKSAGAKTGWDAELTGIWVGKFETGGTTSAPLIKPDIQSLRSQTVSNLFKTSLKFAGGTMSSSGTVSFSGNTTYGLTKDVNTHMMKNTEWGAVAYLSQSQYGKNGNKNYTAGADKEIYKNDSSNFYTGRSSGQPPTSGSSTNGTYSYNGKSCSTINSTTKECTGTNDILKGVGASTTGTIYGIYDMSGGSWEYTMGNWDGMPKDSGFTTFPEQKYWDKYTGSSSGISTSSNAIKGDATYETMKWYSDRAIFLDTGRNATWIRLGCKYDESDAGIFSFYTDPGYALFDTTFRAVLIP